MSDDLQVADEEANKDWLTKGERGALLGIRTVFWFATLFGRWPAKQFVRLISTYYAFTDRKAQEASADWLRHALGREPEAKEVRNHIRSFAQVSLDRIFLLKGHEKAFTVTRTGNHHLEKLTAERTGAILLGAHLGSFEAMRFGADDEDFPLSIVGHFENAKMINALLEEVNPEMAARVIHTGRDPMEFALTVRERLDLGEMVAILGDRVGMNDKSIKVDFFGEPAEFPTGPFLLASALKCPVYLTFGLYSEPNRYDLYCELFEERVVIPRRDREAGLRDAVQKYANRLEFYARKAPYNWFNFYKFWG